MSQIPSSIGPYQVLAQLGEGGMGVVYRGRDPKLDRDVAIKLLPELFANDPDRLARFEREAKSLASLNHPHIAQVYAIEGQAIVMELVEGEDLAERLKRGPIPLDEAIAIAQQIAEALEAAHDAGIIHRDLKPANIKVRDDGTVKVLDFGLAKAVEQGSGTRDQGSGGTANSPTITTPAMTMQGVILGTAAYMAPEQAKGKFVDRRADIWAFGCVLYEMLTGARTFLGEDVSDTLVSILRDDPRWAALPTDTPPHIRQLLRRCLQKDPRKRLPHIGAARIELTDHPPDAPLDRVPEAKGRPWFTIAGAGALVGAAIAAATVYVARPSPATEPREVVRFTVDTAAGSAFTGANGAARFAVSPDGRLLLYQMQDAAGAQLFIRPLDATTSQPLPGTSVPVGGGSAQGAFWSPDGRFVGFFDEFKQQLKKLDRTNGLIQVVAELPGNQLGGSWSDADTIVFASSATGGVRSVSASGGAVTQVTNVDASKGEVAHLWPDFLPDGRHFVYHGQGVGRAIYLGSLDGEAPVRLFESQTAAIVARPDQLLFGHDGALMSRGFDMRQRVLVGEPRTVADQVPATTAGRLAASASRNGVLAHGTGRSVDMSPQETYWVDRAGKALPSAPPSVPVSSGLRLSRDGRSLVYARDGSSSIWIQDTVRGIDSQLAAAVVPGQGTTIMPPAFSPDGGRVLYRQPGAGVGRLVIQPRSGATAPVELLTSPVTEGILPLDWAPDGRILFSRVGLDSGRRLFVLRDENDRAPMPYLTDSFMSGPWGTAVSPDGRWLAYSAGPNNAPQVFIQSFPDPSIAKVAASGLGGAYPRWNPRGDELFYVDGNQRLMAVKVITTPQLEVGRPVALFDLRLGGAYLLSQMAAPPYDVMPDGARFVALRPTREWADRRQSIVVTVNWQQRR